MNMWDLPISVLIGEKNYQLNTDFRDIFEIIEYLQNETDQPLAQNIALSLFYEDVDEIPRHHREKAWKELQYFLACGEEHDDKSAPPQTISWSQDYSMITAEINKLLHNEVRSVPYMHWYTFIGYFNSIGEGQLSSVVNIRIKKAKGQKLDEHEQEFYRNNKARVDFKKACSEKQLEERDRLNKLLGG